MAGYEADFIHAYAVLIVDDLNEVLTISRSIKSLLEYCEV